jgi:hypothetical protein
MSHIQVSAEIARQRATLKLQAIAGMREKEWNSRVLEEMARRGRARFWMPWIKPLTIAQARQRIKDEGASAHGRYPPDIIQWRTEERCKVIILMAKTVVEDDLVAPLVTLSSEDLEHIS